MAEIPTPPADLVVKVTGELRIPGAAVPAVTESFGTLPLGTLGGIAMGTSAALEALRLDLGAETATVKVDFALEGGARGAYVAEVPEDPAP